MYLYDPFIHGNIVHYTIRAHYPVSSSGTAIAIGGLPFTSTGSSAGSLDIAGGMTTALVQNASDNYVGYVVQNTTAIYPFAAGSSARATYADVSGQNLYLFGHYFTTTP